MKAVHKQRLTKLAGLLRADARKKKGVQFDLSVWAAPSTHVSTGIGEDEQRAFRAKPTAVPIDCGTQACAIGLACISGAFKRSGLEYGYTSVGRYDPTGERIEALALIPKFAGMKNWDAVEHFFGVNNATAQRLFLNEFYVETKGAVAERAVANRIMDVARGKDISRLAKVA